VADQFSDAELALRRTGRLVAVMMTGHLVSLGHARE
jgi:hypothetical protein